MTLTYDEALKEEKRLYDLLKDVCVEDLWLSNERLFVRVRGDWKHDHLRCQYLLEEDKYQIKSKFVVEEDGSDWYTADYYFRRVA